MSLFPSRSVATFADVIIAMLQEHPEEWKTDSGGYRLEHPCGLALWTASGFWFVKLYRPQDIKFGWKKIPLWCAVRRVLREAKRQAEMQRLASLHANLVGLTNNVIEFRSRAHDHR